MRKCVSIAGTMLFAALLFVQPSKADNFDTFTLVAKDATITFTLPQTLTPSSVHWGGMIFVNNVPGTFDGGAYTFTTVMLASAERARLKLEADGTVTLNTGVFDLGWYTLTVVDPPGDAVGVPEPASLILLGFGGIALGALRRRKAN